MANENWYEGGWSAFSDDPNAFSRGHPYSGSTRADSQGFPVSDTGDKVIFFVYGNNGWIRWYIVKRYTLDVALEAVGWIQGTASWGMIDELRTGYGLVRTGTGVEGKARILHWNDSGVMVGPEVNTAPTPSEVSAWTYPPEGYFAPVVIGPNSLALFHTSGQEAGFGIRLGYEAVASIWTWNSSTLEIVQATDYFQVWGSSIGNPIIDPVTDSVNGLRPTRGVYREGRIELHGMRYRLSSDIRLVVAVYDGGTFVPFDGTDFGIAGGLRRFFPSSEAHSGQSNWQGERSIVLKHGELAGLPLFNIHTYGNLFASNTHDYRPLWLPNTVGAFTNPARVTAATDFEGNNLSNSAEGYGRYPNQTLYHSCAEGFDFIGSVTPWQDRVSLANRTQTGTDYTVEHFNARVDQYVWNGDAPELVHRWKSPVQQLANGFYSTLAGQTNFGPSPHTAVTRMEERIVVAMFSQNTDQGYVAGWEWPDKRWFQLYYKQGFNIPSLLIPRKQWAYPREREIEHLMARHGVPTQEREQWTKAIIEWSRKRGLADYENYIMFEQWVNQLQIDNGQES